MKPELCIVLPVLNEATTLASRLADLLPLRGRGVRVIMVDGGSDDATLAIARNPCDLAQLAPRGRAAQMNAGAATGAADVNVVLHADTLLGKARAGTKVWGRFDARIVSAKPLLLMLARLMNLRSRRSAIATDDPAMFGTHPAQLASKYGYRPRQAASQDTPDSSPGCHGSATASPVAALDPGLCATGAARPGQALVCTGYAASLLARAARQHRRALLNTTATMEQRHV